MGGGHPVDTVASILAPALAPIALAPHPRPCIHTDAPTAPTARARLGLLGGGRAASAAGGSRRAEVEAHAPQAFTLLQSLMAMGQTLPEVLEFARPPVGLLAPSSGLTRFDRKSGCERTLRPHSGRRALPSALSAFMWQRASVVIFLALLGLGSAKPPRLLLGGLPPPVVHVPFAAGDETFRFEIDHVSRKPGSRARTGRIYTRHGIIETPGFVPVATSAALKGVTAGQEGAANVQLMFANTYHLLVHPGSETVGAAGGVHQYMNRERPMITDSGGFQVFSLGTASSSDGQELKQRHNRREGEKGLLLSTSERGTRFRSYFDSSPIELTPESSVRAQKHIGADIILPLDERPAAAARRAKPDPSPTKPKQEPSPTKQEHSAGARCAFLHPPPHAGGSTTLAAARLDHAPCRLRRLPGQCVTTTLLLLLLLLLLHYRRLPRQYVTTTLLYSTTTILLPQAAGATCHSRSTRSVCRALAPLDGALAPGTQARPARPSHVRDFARRNRPKAASRVGR